MAPRHSRALLAASTLIPVAIAVAVWSGRHPHGREDLDSPREVTATADLHEEVARLRGDIARLGRLSGVAAGVAISARTEMARLKGESKESSGATESTTASGTGLSQDTLMERADQRFQAESQDPAWSREAEVLARRQLTRGLPSTAEIGSLSCHSTMCKGILIYRDSAARDKAVGEMMRSPATDWMGGLGFSNVRSRSDGRIEVDEYLFRPGEDPLGDVFAEEKARVDAQK